MAEAMAGKDVLSHNEIAAFCAQIAMILKAGIPISEGISIMQEDTESSGGKEILSEVNSHLEVGEPFHISLQSTGVFPKYVVDMTEIGETTGRLDEVMDSLYAYYEREDAISKSIRNAVTYPLIMLLMMVVVIGVLIVKVLPIFNQVFVQLGSEMTGFSRGVMNLGQVIGRYSFVLIGIVAVIVIVGLIMRATKGGRQLLQRFNAWFFVTKRLNSKIASGRFASAMSLMMASGLDTDQSLDMTHKLIENQYTRDKIELCQKYIREGSNFSDALVKAELFSGVYAQMVSVGFKTGSVDDVMKKLADRYEQEVDGDISNIIAILEPTLVAILSIVVGMILLSVMLPLMGIMSSIG